MDESEGTMGAPSQMYDHPCGGRGDSDETRSTRPELDLRPTSENELPQEWRKEHLVRTLSAPFDNPTKDVASHRQQHPTAQLLQHPVAQLQHLTAQLQQHQHLKQKGRSQQIPRSSPLTLLPPSVPNSSSESEVCCQPLPAAGKTKYHGCMSHQEAELQLQTCREACFQVRNSNSIALKTSQGCVHIIVAQTKESSFTLDQSSCVFPSIPWVVHHYCTQQLTFTGAEHMTLLHPVLRIH